MKSKPDAQIRLIPDENAIQMIAEAQCKYPRFGKGWCVNKMLRELNELRQTQNQKTK